MSDTTPEQVLTGAYSAEKLSELLHLIYGAATEPRQWSAVLAAVAHSMQGKTGLLYTPFLSPQKNGLIHTLNIPAEKTMLWATKYLEHDLWANRAMVMGLPKQGAILIDSDVCTEEELLASDIYLNLLAQAEVARSLGQGKSTKEVAQELGISPETVRVHTGQVYQKLHIHSQVDLVRCILTLGQASV